MRNEFDPRSWKFAANDYVETFYSWKLALFHLFFVSLFDGIENTQTVLAAEG